MNVLWSYFWPCISAGLLAGVIGGLIGFRRRRRLPFGAAFLVAAALACLWHGPLGAADRLTSKSETYARQALDYYEMTAVTAHLQRDPLSRRLVLSGPADDFQTRELQRVMSQVPGVGRATWSRNERGIPLFAEAIGAALAGALLGMLFAYLADLHRRHNAQWNW